jgi:hypothetical protein
LKAAKVAAEESLRVWTKVEDEFARARTYLKVGDINFALTQWGPARVQYREAKRLCTTMNNQRCIAEAANNIGLVSLNMGDVDDAVSELELARDGWKRIGMLFGVSVS